MVLLAAIRGFSGSLVAVTVGAGNAGDLTLDTQQLTVLDGGTITTTTLNTGQGGNITINASESVTLSGVIPGVFATVWYRQWSDQ